MTTAIQSASPNGALAPLHERYGLSPSQLDLVRTQIAPGAPDDVLELFFVRCKQLGFDPLSKMLFAIPRGGWKKDAAGNFVTQNGKRVWDNHANWTFQTSIDGFRSIAESSEGYAGQDGPFWCGEDGIWKDVWLGKGPPAAAKVGILRHGFDKPLYAVATFEEYAQRDKDGALSGLWAKMGAVLTAKCAEALALRKAFPQRLAGVYANEEMLQAENDRKAELPKAAPKRSPQPALLPAGNDTAEAAQTAQIVKELKDDPIPPQGDIGAETTQAAGVPTEAELGERYARVADIKTLARWLFEECKIDVRTKQRVNNRVILNLDERRIFDAKLQELELRSYADEKLAVQDAAFTPDPASAPAAPTDADGDLALPCDVCGAGPGVPCAADCTADDEPADPLADPPATFEQVELPEGTSTRNQRAQIGILCQNLGIDDHLRHVMIWREFKPKHSARHLDKAQASTFIQKLKDAQSG